MRNPIKLVLFGVGVWLAPFVVGMLSWPLQESVPALFETVVSVAMSGAAVVFGLLYLRLNPNVSLRDTAAVGTLWMAICLLIDAPLFLVGLGWSPFEYATDIGLAYLMVPIVVMGLGAASRAKE
ncbi:MAG: hypothetical protein GKS06_20335 [Acidobacteria bacterium]|nr:hypothetical protein [Acidobacteriota bacterium]